eukprot:CAMPEP_0172451634 /NCGR_PEP_ID=MMETSP1065-20121228/9593_1 /TAXON_ID=265537 /ORGANISM="Amphiprora paludosa, Strain CCMP125" /LENGTH=267 /DNA_ID=CAMNT_0013203597 /DNA_START=52 /DNA_END=855 /DNA_ORIENTATION=+
MSATTTAIAGASVTTNNPDKTPSTDADPPEFIHQHLDPQTGECLRDVNGHIVLHALPAMIDMKFDVQVYEQQLISYLDALFGETTGEKEENSTKDCKKPKESNQEQSITDQKVTVLLDVRPGTGWPNPPALQTVGLIRHLINQLHTRYPNRLHKLILYPIPRAAIVIYNLAIKPLLSGHAELKQAMTLVPGAGVAISSPVPGDALQPYVPWSALQVTEDYRLSHFVTTPPNNQENNSNKLKKKAVIGECSTDTMSTVASSTSSLSTS